MATHLIAIKDRINFCIQRVIALCFLFFVGCSAPEHQWGIQEVVTRQPRFNSGRLFLEPASNTHHLSLEIVRTQSGVRFYINLLFLEIHSSNEDPTAIKVICDDTGETLIIYPHVLQGGQRLLLNVDDTNRLIQQLLDEKNFTICLGMNQITIHSTQFSSMYQQLLKIPIEEIGSN
jgi:hypothetical protein